MELPTHLRYTEEHEWVQLEGEFALVGVTDYAQTELGDVVFVELPEAGTTLVQGGVFGTIEAVKTVSDLYAPVSGEIVEVNGDLADQPELVNGSPYGDGWMIKIKVSDVGEVDSLMDADAYQEMIGEEA
jgi:glycine cleavage system H protein